MRARNSAFTLLELLTVMVIVAILAAMVLQSMGNVQARADFARCVTNMRSLYVAAAMYVDEQGHWPQISPSLNKGASPEYARQWVEALRKYGVAPAVWVCPTVQRTLGFPDIDKAASARVDYMATPFDDKPRRPYQWSTQPWFIEKAASHAGGPLLIFADGLTVPLRDAVKRTNTGE